MSRLLPAIFVAAFFSQSTLAQPGNSFIFDDSELDFYLLQAFQASSAEQRIALNHIGIQVQAADEGYLVTASLEDYPAQLAGIERGDRILTVNGEPFHPVYSFNEPTIAADGEPTRFAASHSAYELEVSRNGTTRSLQLTPVYENLFDSYRTATTNSVQVFPAGNKTIGYVRFWGISRASADIVSMEKIMQQLANCDGLIFDLRNSFGYLSASHLDLIVPSRRSYFVATGAPNTHGDLQPAGITSDGDYYQSPIAVMLNSETRGGPELFAYQLAKMRRVVTLGETTPGRIGDYVLETNGEDSQLRYIPAEDVLIDGGGFESIGVEPEQVIAYPFEQTTRSDPQYETTLLFLLGII